MLLSGFLVKYDGLRCLLALLISFPRKEIGIFFPTSHFERPTPWNADLLAQSKDEVINSQLSVIYFDFLAWNTNTF